HLDAAEAVDVRLAGHRSDNDGRLGAVDAWPRRGARRAKIDVLGAAAKAVLIHRLVGGGAVPRSAGENPFLAGMMLHVRQQVLSVAAKMIAESEPPARLEGGTVTAALDVQALGRLLLAAEAGGAFAVLENRFQVLWVPRAVTVHAVKPRRKPGRVLERL